MIPTYGQSSPNVVLKNSSDTISKEDSHIYANPFPDEILNTTILKEMESGKEITLKEMLLKYKDQPLYLDFWASWCGGCRMDIKNSKEMKKLLANNGIQYIYMSGQQRTRLEKSGSNRWCSHQSVYVNKRDE